MKEEPYPFYGTHKKPVTEPVQTKPKLRLVPTPIERPRRHISAHAKRVIGATALTVVGIAGLYNANRSPHAPVEQPSIVALANNNTKEQPVYQVTVPENGTISGVVNDFARAEGDTSKNISEEVISDSNAIADVISPVPGGGVDAGTTFDVHPEHPIVDPSAIASIATLNQHTS